MIARTAGMDRARRVTLLYDLEEERARPEVDEVAVALIDAGLEVDLLVVRDDFDALAAGLSQQRPELVVNLVQRFAGNPRLAPDVAAALDLLRVPYTGAGPSGLYLAADPDLARRLLASHGVAGSGRGPSAHVVVLGNERLTLYPMRGTGAAAPPAADELLPALQVAHAALRLRDYAVIEAELGPEPAIVRAVPNPPLRRDGLVALAAAAGGLSYTDLLLGVVDEAWKRHVAVAPASKTA
jgi:hypothetical protein